ncbi:toprim domain-containing protein [Bradyrhizobium sp. CCBAU 051011]|uniref:toprim domain-containing protein n=1 Tax=Bradyrhizobium sp. CCBAU 051011 TaxID=858422 RepID=UPI00352A5510
MFPARASRRISRNRREALHRIVARGHVRLVAATDNNRQGDVYAERIQAIAAEAGLATSDRGHAATDWNEDLKALPARFSRPQLVAFA